MKSPDHFSFLTRRRVAGSTMLPFVALIAFISSVTFVALCGGGKKDKDGPKGAGGPVVQKNDIAPAEGGECPKDTVADVKSSWGGDGEKKPP